MNTFRIILVAVIFAVIANTYARDSVIRDDELAEAEYNFNDIFINGALMYKPDKTEGLAFFDLDDSIVTVSVYGPPHNCLKITIIGNDGKIRGPCVRNSMNDGAAYHK